MEAAKQWRQTRCTIVSSEIKTKRDPEEVGGKYWLELSYRYQSQDSADGVRSGEELTHDCYDLWFRETFEDHALVQAFADRLKPGTTVPCYYDPQHPRTATIERAPRPMFRYFILLGVYPVVGLGFLVAGLIQRLRRASRPGNAPPPATTEGSG
jgi:hypothetical protein